MSATAVASTAPAYTMPVADDVSSSAVDVAVSLKDEALAAHAAVLKAGMNGDAVDKDALNKLVDVIGTETAEPVSRDALLAHTLLLSTFHRQTGDSEAKDLAFLCAAEVRYLAFLDALAKAVVKDKSLIETPPLPPMDVAMFWHSHMLSPLRFADDMTRRYDSTFDDMSLPLMRLAKVAIGTNKDDLEASRQFWAKNMPADMPYDITPADVDETKVIGRVVCPFCTSELALTMPEYAALRLHGQEHMCTHCAAEFMAEHVAVQRFLTMVKHAPVVRIAGTQSHPKTREPKPMLHANMTDLAALFDKAKWVKYSSKLPTLATWDDVKNMVMAPIMKGAADSLILPGNRLRFAMVIHAHKDAINGPWAMDMVRAVRRQRRFSRKMADLVQSGPSAVYHFQTEALVQYPKFLAMAVAHPSKPLVPTTAIDLAWHTHQLFPAVYSKHTLMLTGSVMNHDDSDDAKSEARIADGGKAIETLWMRTYGEEFLDARVPCTQGAKYHATETELLALYLTPGTCNVTHLGTAERAARCYYACAREVCDSMDVAKGAAKDTTERAARCYYACAREVCDSMDVAKGAAKDTTERAARCYYACAREVCDSMDVAKGAAKDTTERAARCYYACAREVCDSMDVANGTSLRATGF
ncbi:hypothetical protein AMAG_12499 [Allomyces macrogynus ATCC 38327]|uniref:Uncharacterized protein n=1 Tax=Allomyces macrogynus (strain ATCC 38327) TaxID=578462 RepID=A0A0L0SZK3_ALLM3|nr:hypothetical protein AMAG_12499 [Allomyces macrogynus ATCC 38327]|eukprot:KNE67774.1 hypothetical protein AMAG_12499 [Allomyces macrogynus ATCC 38327]